MSLLNESREHRENGKQGLSAFCAEFGLTEQEIAGTGTITHIGRRCFLTLENQKELIVKLKKDLFGVGVYLGEEKERFEPSAALIEIIASKTKKNKIFVDDKAAWLFLCDRDILKQGVACKGDPTASGYILVQNQQDESLGYGRLPGPKDKKRSHDIYLKNLLDRGNFLRRERFE